MKPYNFTTRRHRIKANCSLDLVYALVIHYVSCKYDIPLKRVIATDRSHFFEFVKNFLISQARKP